MVGPPTPASPEYKICLCHIKAQEFAVFYKGSIRYQVGDILLDTRFLHNCLPSFNTLYGRLLSSWPASQSYKIYSSVIFSPDVTGSYLEGAQEAGGGGLRLNGYFVSRLLISLSMDISMGISLYIRTIVE